MHRTVIKRPGGECSFRCKLTKLNNKLLSSISTYVITVPERYRRTEQTFRPFKVRRSNLGPILHRFGDIDGFFVLLGDPTRISPNFGCVPVAPNRPCWGQPKQKPQAIRPQIIFEVFQPMSSQYLKVTDGQNVSAVQGHPRSLILVPIKSVYVTSY